MALAHGGDAEVDLHLTLRRYQHPGALERAKSGGLHVRGDANSVVATLLVGPLPLGQSLIIDLLQRPVEGAGVVAAVEYRVASVQARRPGVVWHLAGGDQVAASQFRRIQAKVAGNHVQQALAYERSLEEPGRTVGAGAHLVGHHAIYRGLEVGDAVGAGHHHRGQGRHHAAVGAHVGPHVAVDRGAKAQQRAVALGGYLHLALHLPGVVGRRQVLDSVLHPFDRPPQPE